MTKYKIVLVAFLLNLKAFSQNFKENEVILFETNNISTNYYVYEPPFAARGIYKDTLEAVNNFPEQVLSSIVSSTSYAWDKYNYLNGETPAKSKSHYEKAIQLNKYNNYFELRSKYEFFNGENPCAFIKFHIKFEELKVPAGGFRILEKVNGRWYVSLIPNFAAVPYLLFWFKEVRMLELLTGKSNGNILSDKLIAQTRDSNGNLDFEKLGDEVTIILKEGKTSERFKYFIDEIAFNY